MSKSLLTGISRVVIALVSAVLFAAGVSAQVGANQDPMLDPAIKYTIVGTVEFAPTNMELRGIKVELFAPSGEPLNSVFTDSRGYFEFGNLPLGYYTVTINEEGFEPYKEMVGIVGRPGARVYVRLRPAAKDGKPAAPGNAVSARELALPQKTQDTLHKGLDALFENRDAAKSVTFFEQVIQLSPDYYEAYYDEGVAYLRLKKMDEAETAFHKAVDLSKGHFAEPYIELASIYADKEKFPDAETMARKGMGIQPDSWRAHYELARILYGEGLPVDAEQSALEAKRLEPKFPKLYIVLANIQLRLGKNQAVVEDLDTYLKLAPDGAYTSQAKELKEKTEKLLGHPAPPPPSSH
jgi:tetratricopeptide (TPR) repeat protein